ncbi:hypothetical protein LC087_18975 (plasmid) [Bacillus carboniphilus]|uniref:Uncharacterized protein n=1 Tax=Bacillus carboniphilus TaxID=86663 RepID=A0ABY9JYA4_9BACI|nr:hypothetical protein [Bacillus carboniphilus]WLR44394.1 hypothetical protein LC087_18975 [Bacillus carboniphilus]
MFNNSEDIKISTLAKILTVVNKHTPISDYKLTDLFDEKVLRISNTIASLSDESPETIIKFIESENELFMDLIADWGSLLSKNKLSDEEQLYLKDLKQLIHTFTNKGDNT